MKHRTQKIAACLMASVLMMSGCSLPGKETDTCPYEEFLVVDVFDSLSNYQGIQSGWFAKIVKDKFNMELNIIAPNVSGGGDTLFEVGSAAGNLGDLIICSGENGRLQELVSRGLLADLNSYLEDKQIMRFETAIRLMNDPVEEGSIYAIPSELSMNDPSTPKETVESTYSPCIRWDLYQALGYPQVETLEDLLPLLLEMQELEPIAENGEKTYGFSFFRDWDKNMMAAAKQFCSLYGYEECGFVLVKGDGSDFQNIVDPDSLYVRSLHLLFEANQMGLVDPESGTQSYGSLYEKYEAGQILFSPWPWLSKIQYNTDERKSEGKGYMMIDIADMEIYSYGCSPEGNYNTVIAVGSKAKDPERMADFIDWLYSPEGIQLSGADSLYGTAGPEGLCWEYGENGPYLTEFGEQALSGIPTEMPESYGGCLWSDGICRLNYTPVCKSDPDNNGYPYQYQLWDSLIESDSSPLEEDWRRVMNADTSMEYLIENDKLLVSPGCGYTAEEETTEETTIRTQCQNAIQSYSWNMVFASDETAFSSLLSELQEELNSLGYEKLLALDLKNAKAREQKKQETLEKYSITKEESK
ncbi:MAG: ABC transporter substrate-binding protein [Fusicatenibacter sp.]|nr:ABC transporter substrate-binding protein [Fusicatenibacter sp.]